MVCLSTPSVSGRYGIWFYMQFCPSYHFAGASPLPLDVGYILMVWSNILLSMVVQQRVVILELLPEKMSAHPFTLPSCFSMVFGLEKVLIRENNISSFQRRDRWLNCTHIRMWITKEMVVRKSSLVENGADDRWTDVCSVLYLGCDHLSGRLEFLAVTDMCSNVI